MAGRRGLGLDCWRKLITLKNCHGNRKCAKLMTSTFLCHGGSNNENSTYSFSLFSIVVSSVPSPSWFLKNSLLSYFLIFSWVFKAKTKAFQWYAADTRRRSCVTWFKRGEICNPVASTKGGKICYHRGFSATDVHHAGKRAWPPKSEDWKI